MADTPEPAPRYVLGAEIGRGGLGRVVEAWDPELKRTIAVKLVLEGLPAELRERFRREAEVTGRLEHPNIVPVHDLWEDRATGRVHLAMKRIRGRDLASLVRDLAAGNAEAAKAWSRARLIRVVQDLCLGIAYAHANGVIHRDLKPSNVMLGEFGETLIVDWGLARAIGEPVPGGAAAPAALPAEGVFGAQTVRYDSPELTREGQIVGTPAYMPPEQAEGRLADMGPRSDVYALGAILYEVLTLRPPVQGATMAELITRVRSGAVAPPSSHATPTLTIPPELDAICLKALARRPEDRYPTAMALHEELQLFLEGVKERERRSREAADRVEKGRQWAVRGRELKADIAAQEQLGTELRERIMDWQTPEEKRPLLEARARLRSLKEERILALTQAAAEFAQALVVDPGCESAADGQCELILDRLAEAEASRDADAIFQCRNMLRLYDRSGTFRARLEAPGKLTIRTRAFGCRCLEPVRVPGWRVEFGAEATVPWRDGRRVEAPLERPDYPVPALRTFPEGRTFGHGPGCAAPEVRGARVSVARFEESDRRLLPGPWRPAGTTPIEELTLPQGTWLCLIEAEGFAPVRFPVLVERGGSRTQDVTLYRPAEIPEGFCLVPGGPFLFGGIWAGGDFGDTRTTRDAFVARFPVTCAEYLAFINDLAASGRLEEARKRQPRSVDRKLWIEREGRFELPPPGREPGTAWDPRWPVFSVDWHDALAWCSWRSARDGVVHELLHEEEYEKACRGVDGRIWSFGNEYDGAWSHTMHSLKDGMTPLPVGSFAADESPYGLRDLSGGMETWCSNAPAEPVRHWRCLRGGAWGSTPHNARAAYRHGMVPDHLFWRYGIRTVVHPVRD